MDESCCQQREMPPGIGRDGFKVAGESEAGGQLVGDELEVGRVLERQAGLEELAGRCGPGRAEDEALLLVASLQLLALPDLAHLQRQPAARPSVSRPADFPAALAVLPEPGGERQPAALPPARTPPLHAQRAARRGEVVKVEANAQRSTSNPRAPVECWTLGVERSSSWAIGPSSLAISAPR